MINWYEKGFDDDNNKTVIIIIFFFLLTGLWAVINTAGSPCRGRLENQDSPYWDAVMKQNVTGTLKVAKTFLPLLRNKKGKRICN